MNISTILMTDSPPAIAALEVVQRGEAIADGLGLQNKILRVDPKFASWLSSLTENPYKSLRVDPDSGSAL
jgi:hypothetical protein